MTDHESFLEYIQSGGLALPKFCVFCGEKPISKTKEHVIPDWLINHTGNPKRKVNLGYEWFTSGGRQREYSFDQFAFPACDECNSSFSRLETETKPIIIKMLGRKPISARDIDRLFDWLDKVRIGIWLGLLMLNKISAFINPKFYIKSRIRKSDRFLAIAFMENVGDGLSFSGIDTMLGQHMPSCFGLRINDLYLINASTDLLVSKSLGLPTFNRSTLEHVNRFMKAGLVSGSGRLSRPFVNTPIPQYCTKYAQAIRPIFYEDMERTKRYAPDELQDAYAKRIYRDDSTSEIYFESNAMVRKYSLRPCSAWHPQRSSSQHAKSVKQLTKAVLRLQLDVNDFIQGNAIAPITEMTAPMKFNKTARKFQVNIINMLDRRGV